MTARGWERVRRVAVTIADLAESEVITGGHVAEALAWAQRDLSGADYVYWWVGSTPSHRSQAAPDPKPANAQSAA